MFLFLLIAILGFILQLFLPWWILAIVAFACALLLAKKPVQAFSAGLFGSGLPWIMMALFIHLTRGEILTNRIAELLSLPSPLVLYAGSFLIAGVTGGLAALAGYYLKSILTSDREINSAT
jgi:hypothetical protein